MLKLYRLSDTEKSYWETWENNGEHTVHWGQLGTRGDFKHLTSSPDREATAVIQDEVHQKAREGFRPIESDHHFILLIEYPVEGMGTAQDIEKRHKLQARMNDTLGWTGLGHCDGGSIGSGTMEVCCFVVDFEIASRVIAQDLEGTEFRNFTRIYKEG